MKKTLFYFFLVLAVIGIVYYGYKTTINRNPNPVSKPFTLNTNVSLKSIIKEGYTFKSGECEQVWYSKKYKDTTIIYSWYGDTSERICSKEYKFAIGNSIDLKKIKHYLSKKGVLLKLADWNEKNGGKATVYNPKEEIYFDCSIRREKNDFRREEWFFSYYKMRPFDFRDHTHIYIYTYELYFPAFILWILYFFVFCFLLKKLIKSKRKVVQRKQM